MSKRKRTKESTRKQKEEGSATVVEGHGSLGGISRPGGLEAGRMGQRWTVAADPQKMKIQLLIFLLYGYYLLLLLLITPVILLYCTPDSWSLRSYHSLFIYTPIYYYRLFSGLLLFAL